jgi:hypothetical protein
MSVSLYGSGNTVIQVQSTTLTSSFSWTTKNAWTSITGLSVSITPQSTTSKILIMVQLSTGDGGQNYPRGYTVARNGTQLNLSTANSGTGNPGSFATTVISNVGGGNQTLQTIPFVFLDSPSTTSAITYQVQGFAYNSSVTTSYINQAYSAGGDTQIASSTITVMEISGS